MKKILLFIGLFVYTLFPGVSYAYPEWTQEELKEKIFLKKQELEINIPKGKQYVKSLDVFFQKHSQDTQTLEVLFKRVGDLKNKLTDSQRDSQVLLIIEYIEYKANLLLGNTITEGTITKENILEIHNSDLVYRVIQLSEGEKRDLVYNMYESEDHIYALIQLGYDIDKNQIDISEYYDFLIFYYYYQNTSFVDVYLENTTQFLDLDPNKIGDYKLSEVTDYIIWSTQDQQLSLINKLYASEYEIYSTILLGYSHNFSNIEDIKNMGDISNYYGYLIYFKHLYKQSTQDTYVSQYKNPVPKSDADIQRVHDLKILQISIEQTYQDNLEYPSHFNLRDRISNYIYELPVDSKQGETVNGCRFGYYYQVGDYGRLRNGKYILSTCLENGEEYKLGIDTNGEGFGEKFLIK